MIKCLAGFALCFLQILPALGADVPKIPSEKASQLADEVVTKLGLKAALLRLPSQMLQGFQLGAMTAGQSGKRKISPEELRDIENAMSESYVPSQLIATITADLALSGDEKKLRTIIAGLDTPLMQRMTAMEMQAPSPAETSALLSKAVTTPLPATRIALLRDLESAMHATELTSTMQIAGFRAMAMNVTCGRESALAAFDAGLAKNKLRLEEGTRNGLLAAMTVVYRTADDNDLRDYASVLRTDSMRWLYAQVFDSLNSGMAQQSGRFGGKIMQIAAKHGKSRSKDCATTVASSGSVSPHVAATLQLGEAGTSAVPRSTARNVVPGYSEESPRPSPPARPVQTVGFRSYYQ